MVRRWLLRGQEDIAHERLGQAGLLSTKAQRRSVHAGTLHSRYGGEDLGVIYERLERDGFTRLGDNWGRQQILGTRKYQVACEGDDGWGRQFSRRHPTVKVRYAGYLEHGYTFVIWLDEHPRLLDGASWANWDVNGELWVAWPGMVEQYTLNDLSRGTPSFSIDLDQLEPPVKTDTD